MYGEQEIRINNWSKSKRGCRDFGPSVRSARAAVITSAQTETTTAGIYPKMDLAASAELSQASVHNSLSHLQRRTDLDRNEPGKIPNRNRAHKI